jgi:galactosamine-6-phosphate isomerase
MYFHESETAESLGEQAAEFLAGKIAPRTSFTLCAATGDSPTLTYRELVKNQSRFQSTEITIVKLDEWGGIAGSHPSSCEFYLRENLLGPLQIRSERYISFNGMAADPDEECRRVQQLLHQIGTIHVCILGLGMNGHIAFNEPADFLEKGCHVAVLSESSRRHPMALGMEKASSFGFTLGMADIMQAETLVFLVSGPSKKQIFKRFMNGPVTPNLPASFLWLHPEVHCFYTRDSLY